MRIRECQSATISFGAEQFKWIEKTRGDIPRSTFIAGIVKEKMNEQRKNDT